MMKNRDTASIAFALLLSACSSGAAAQAEPAPASGVEPARTGAAPPADAAAPGCAAETARRRCASASGNAGEMQACNDAALKGAQQELRRVLDKVGPDLQRDAGLLDAFAAAQMAWQSWLQRDCDAVAADFAGGAMQSAMTTGCLYEHTLARAQSIWQRHAGVDGAEIPVGCLPNR
jgi:uncharacterized protein YecT (DUF1311 family)